LRGQLSDSLGSKWKAKSGDGDCSLVSVVEEWKSPEMDSSWPRAAGSATKASGRWDTGVPQPFIHPHALFPLACEEAG